MFCGARKCVSSGHVFVIVSGDIAYSGKADQYSLATTFLSAISDCIKKQVDIPLSFIVVPGNHDCDFELDKQLKRFRRFKEACLVLEVDRTILLRGINP